MAWGAVKPTPSMKKGLKNRAPETPEARATRENTTEAGKTHQWARKLSRKPGEVPDAAKTGSEKRTANRTAPDTNERYLRRIPDTDFVSSVLRQHPCPDEGAEDDSVGEMRRPEGHHRLLFRLYTKDGTHPEHHPAYH